MNKIEKNVRVGLRNGFDRIWNHNRDNINDYDSLGLYGRLSFIFSKFCH